MQGETVHVLTEQALRDSDEHLRTIIETAQNGIAVLDHQDRFVFFNRGLCDILGYSQAEMVNMPLGRLVREEDREQTYERLERGLREFSSGERRPITEHYQLKMTCKDGRVIDVEIFASPFEQGGETVGSLMEIRDVTEDVALHADATATASELTNLLEAAPSAIILADQFGTILRVNPAVCEIFGWPESELLGQSVSILTEEPVRSQHDAYVSHYNLTGEASTGGGLVFGGAREVTGRRKDGTLFPLELSVAEGAAADGSRTYTAVIRDITERKDAERNRELAQRATVRSEFLSTMSHELRTPLNSILGFSELLAEGKRDRLTERQRRYVGEVTDAGKHLLSLINELLDISKIDAGAYELAISLIDPAAVVAAVVGGMEATASAKGIALTVSTDGAPARVAADERALRQVLMNLLSNAIKFTEQGGVEIDVSTSNDELVITVADSGTGIPEQQLGDVFGEFTQLDAGRAAGGTGLGLAITRRLVELHGGTIEATSTLGSGSTFTVRLPLGEHG